MTIASPELNAAVRAIQGESDVDAVWPVFGGARLSRVVALAPDTPRIVRALAALRGGLPALLDPPTIADPALHDAVARMIGAPEGWNTLMLWAQFAPAGWGAAHTTALVDAVTTKTCAAGCAAALIGPCDTSARLLRDACNIEFAVRHWGKSFPDAPTAWMDMISARERNRLLNTLRCEPFHMARCLPWLRPDRANRPLLNGDTLMAMLSAFAEASPTARSQHAAFLRYLVAQAHPSRLDTLTRLACAAGAEKVWSRVHALIRESPDDAGRVVETAPWDDLHEMVRNVIVELHPAIGAARGRHATMPKNISEETAIAFFAALDPNVWNALNLDEQRRWSDELPDAMAHLAIRSLGLHTEFLTRAALDNDLVHAAQRHACDEAMLRDAMLPVALRKIPIADAHALITALRKPSDPGAFFLIASGHPDPNKIGAAGATLCTNADLARAVALQRCTASDLSIRSSCATLRDMLHGWSWSDLAPIIALLSYAARSVLIPDRDALTERLAHPDRKEALRQSLNRLASFPPSVAIPTYVALKQLTLRNTPDSAEMIADRLRADGDVFVALTNALGDDRLRTTLLPLPEENTAAAEALRMLARDNPLSAHRLAHALRDQSWIAALHALLTAPPRHVDVVWQALPDDVRSKMVAAVATASSDADPISISCPIAALALAAVRSDDIDLQNKGLNVLTMNPDLTRTIWDALPQKTQQALRDHLAFTDLSMTHARSDGPSASRHWRR